MTLKRWLRMFGIRTAKIVFALSLLLSCLSFGAGDPATQQRQLQGLPPEQQLRKLNEWADRGELDPVLAAKVSEINGRLLRRNETPAGAPKDWLAKQIQSCMELLKFQEKQPPAPVSDDSVARAKAIKSAPVYQDTGPKKTPNWLGRAFDRLENVQPSCNCNPRNVNAPSAPVIGPWFMYTIIVILAAILLAFVVFAVSRASWSKRLKRKAKALLDEDEPERTLDEWLERADKLEKEGKYREAVRCLYLACLLKIDEARVARFERSQTNWEHLERIDASPRKPVTLSFLEPTKAFDLIWYGMQVNGASDVARFRSWYLEVTEAVKVKEVA